MTPVYPLSGSLHSHDQKSLTGLSYFFLGQEPSAFWLSMAELSQTSPWGLGEMRESQP